VPCRGDDSGYQRRRRPWRCGQKGRRLSCCFVRWERERTRRHRLRRSSSGLSRRRRPRRRRSCPWSVAWRRRRRGGACRDCQSLRRRRAFQQTYGGEKVRTVFEEDVEVEASAGPASSPSPLRRDGRGGVSEALPGRREGPEREAWLPRTGVSHAEAAPHVGDEAGDATPCSLTPRARGGVSGTSRRVGVEFLSRNVDGVGGAGVEDDVDEGEAPVLEARQRPERRRVEQPDGADGLVVRALDLRDRVEAEEFLAPRRERRRGVRDVPGLVQHAVAPARRALRVVDAARLAAVDLERRRKRRRRRRPGAAKHTLVRHLHRQLVPRQVRQTRWVRRLRKRRRRPLDESLASTRRTQAVVARPVRNEVVAHAVVEVATRGRRR